MQAYFTFDLFTRAPYAPQDVLIGSYTHSALRVNVMLVRHLVPVVHHVSVVLLSK